MRSSENYIFSEIAFQNFVFAAYLVRELFSAVKLHMGSGLELCIPLKIKNFQKMVVKIALPMPRP